MGIFIRPNFFVMDLIFDSIQGSYWVWRPEASSLLLSLHKINKFVKLISICNCIVIKPSHCEGYFFVVLLQFPYCDGTHNKHNQETGDNVGPLVIKKKVED